jgi:hypothetical protein
MDREITLDDGALRRLWQGAHAIVADATSEEIHRFFTERAKTVYRNRKLENPTGLMLASISDWFPERRVLQRRKALLEDAKQAVDIQRQLGTQLAELRSMISISLADEEKRR